VLAVGAPPQRTTALAQVIPAPNPENKTRSPSLSRPASAASAKAIPQEAAEVLPVWSRQIALRSASMPSLWLTASTMRMLAWWGMKSAMSSAVTSACFKTRWADSTVARTALRKTSRPSMYMKPPLSQQRIEAKDPSTKVMGQDERLALGGLDDNGASAVTEEHGGVAVVLVCDLGQGVRPDEKRPFVAGVEQGHRRHEAVDKAGASGIQVEGGSSAAEPVVHRRRGGGHDLVWCGRGEHQEVDLGRAAPRPNESAPGGVDGETGRCASVASLPYSGSLDYPLVARIETGFVVGIRDDLFRQGHAPTGDLRASHAVLSSLRVASSRTTTLSSLMCESSCTARAPSVGALNHATG